MQGPLIPLPHGVMLMQLMLYGTSQLNTLFSAVHIKPIVAFAHTLYR